MSAVLSALRQQPVPKIDLRVREAFVFNMLFAHALMIASENLIKEVLGRTIEEKPLRDFYEKHLSDERDHALWMSEDLRELGETPTFNWKAAQIAGTQYYIVRHGDPRALLGYMAALECRPMALAHVVELEKLYGANALRTVRYHAEHDIEHGMELLRLIETLGTPECVLYNASLTASMLAWALEYPAQQMKG